MPIALRVITFIVLFLLVAPVRAGADWLLIPYAGVRFGGTTALSDLDNAAGERSYTLGLSVAGLGAGVLGVEADVGHTPGFFQRGDHPVPSITRSGVTSISSNAILTLPISVTRESLRPYVLFGVGWLRATAKRADGDYEIHSMMAAVTLGVGAIGYFSDETGLRFDLRLHRSLGQGDDELPGLGHRLRFWRGTIGIIRRF